MYGDREPREARVETRMRRLHGIPEFLAPMAAMIDMQKLEVRFLYVRTLLMSEEDQYRAGLWYQSLGLRKTISRFIGTE